MQYCHPLRHFMTIDESKKDLFILNVYLFSLKFVVRKRSYPEIPDYLDYMELKLSSAVSVNKVGNSDHSCHF